MSAAAAAERDAIRALLAAAREHLGARVTPALIDKLAQTLTSLHAVNLVWLNFDPEALAEDRGGLRITNLDLEVASFGRSPFLARTGPAFNSRPKTPLR